VVDLRLVAIPGELGCASYARQRLEAVRGAVERRLVLANRRARLSHVDKQVAQQLARGRDRPRRDVVLLGGLLGLGRRARERQCLVVSTFRSGDPRGGGTTLDLDLLSPVGILER